MQSRNRPNAITRLWNNALKAFQRDGQLKGSQIPLNSSGVGASWREKYDLEIDELAVRDVCGSLETTRLLIEMMTWCDITRSSVSYAARDVLRSKHGDSTGWSIADTLDDEETPIHPDVKAILDDLLERKQDVKEYVLGGSKLKRAVRLFLGYGDCFQEIEVAKEGLSKGGRYGDYGVSATLYLPTWQMFVKEDRQGRITSYEQRSRVASETDSIAFFPEKIAHYKYEEQSKYGQSINLQSVDPWRKLKKVEWDIEEAVRSLGVTPNLHIMPESWDGDEARKAAYRSQYEQAVAEGVVSDLYLSYGADVRKMSGVNNDLASLFRQRSELRYQLVPPGFPIWLFPGLGVGYQGAREISGEPAKAYDGIRAEVAAILTEGIKQICDTELKLRLGLERFSEIGRYRVQFPDFTENTAAQEDDSNTGSKQDGDSRIASNEDDFEDGESRSIGNGHRRFIFANDGN